MNAASVRGQRLALVAADFVGTPFRLHGRSRASGLDCVGLVCAALGAIGEHPVAPEGYALRNTGAEGWFGHAEQSGLVRVSEPVLAGDIIAMRSGPGQLHLIIATDPGEGIHAHAGLRRVVRQKVDFGRDLLAQWRLL